MTGVLFALTDGLVGSWTVWPSAVSSFCSPAACRARKKFRRLSLIRCENFQFLRGICRPVYFGRSKRLTLPIPFGWVPAQTSGNFSLQPLGYPTQLPCGSCPKSKFISSWFMTCSPLLRLNRTPKKARGSVLLRGRSLNAAPSKCPHQLRVSMPRPRPPCPHRRIPSLPERIDHYSGVCCATLGFTRDWPWRRWYEDRLVASWVPWSLSWVCLQR